MNEPNPLDNIDARKRAAGFPDVRDATFEKFERIHKLHSGHHIHEADSKYEIGELVVEMVDDRGTYGADVVGTLEKSLGIKKTALHEYAHVARTWNPDRFTDLMSRVDSRGLPLSFYHLIEARRIVDPLERSKWIDRALEFGWTVRELRAARAEVDNEPVSSDDTGGSADTNAEDSEAEAEAIPFLMVRRALTEMRTTIHRVQDGVVTWRLRIFSPLTDDPAEFGAAVLGSLSQTRIVCVDSIQTLHELIERLDDAILSASEAAAAAEAAEGVNSHV